MNSETATALVAAAIETARGMGLSISVAIYDEGACMTAFHRMDDAMLGTVDVACRKAKTSVLFPLTTRDFGALCRHEKLDGMLGTNEGLIGFAGGMPVPGGGAIGISGGSADEDETIAVPATNTL